MMKRTVYLVLLLLCGTALLPACKKKNEAKPKVEIDAKNLTDCPDGYTCQSLFTEQADIGPTFNLQSGGYRLFWHSEQREGLGTRLFIRAPMQGDSFELGSAAIAAGAVDRSFDCPACSFVAYKIAGGLVKGINTTPGKRADQTKWLIEATIVTEAVNDASMKDTLKVKQYYYPNFVID